MCVIYSHLSCSLCTLPRQGGRKYFPGWLPHWCTASSLSPRMRGGGVSGGRSSCRWTASLSTRSGWERCALCARLQHSQRKLGASSGAVGGWGGRLETWDLTSPELGSRCCGCCCCSDFSHDSERERIPNGEASRMFCSDGTFSAVSFALLLGITCLIDLCELTEGSSDFSGWKLVFIKLFVWKQTSFSLVRHLILNLS